MESPVLEMKGISKSFGSNLALSDVNLQLHRGEVMGLIGENGAGKSTLMKILSGVYKQDKGDIFLNGKKFDNSGTDSSQKLGISIIYQELSLFPDFNAVENIFINREVIKGKRLKLVKPYNRKLMREKAQEILTNELAVNIDIDKPVRDLNLSQRQLIEIARILTTESQIIIMDEPTAALEISEREQLFKIIRRLKEAGNSIVFVSHALEEVLSICDNILVLRDGKQVADISVKELDVNKVINLMIGKSLTQQYPKEVVGQGECVLSVKNLTKNSYYQDISFDLHQGEIIGIAGLEGCGKSELVRTLFGSMRYDGGTVIMKNKETKIQNINDGMQNGFAFLPADRKTEGLFLSQDIKWNTSIAKHKKFPGFFINPKKEEADATSYIKDLGIKAQNYKQTVGDLSGGNQQKVMIARWLLAEPDIILLEEPTRGIDVNAKVEVYKLIMECVKKGKSVIIVSSEGPELLGICDKIIVLYEGRISTVLNPKDATEEELAYYSVHSTTGGK